MSEEEKSFHPLHIQQIRLRKSFKKILTRHQEEGAGSERSEPQRVAEGSGGWGGGGGAGGEGVGEQFVIQWLGGDSSQKLSF